MEVKKAKEEWARDQQPKVYRSGHHQYRARVEDHKGTFNARKHWSVEISRAEGMYQNKDLNISVRTQATTKMQALLVADTVMGHLQAMEVAIDEIMGRATSS